METNSTEMMTPKRNTGFILIGNHNKHVARIGIYKIK